MLTVIWRSSARDEFHQILDYIAERNIGAAERLESAVKGCAERLAEHPFMYRPGRVRGTREAIVHPNYIMVYRVGVDAIEIVNVLHARQQYP